MEALVCASCPEAHHDEVTAICMKSGIQKAFGKAGDMVDSLSPGSWLGKWEAKVRERKKAVKALCQLH